jgi:hypothetical protein
MPPWLDYMPPWLDDMPPWLDDMPPWLDETPNDNFLWTDKKNDFIEKIKTQGFSSVWHITHRNNIKEILNKGILSNYLAYEIAKPIDISDHGAQRWREAKEPIYKRKIHEYAPTYFNVKNPMLYVKHNIQDELCLIEISLNSLLDSEFIFTDGNAASRDTTFYHTVNDLEQLPWEVLRASYWNSFSDGKRKRCAELLFYPLIATKHIVKIHCSSAETLNYIRQLGCPVQISSDLFFIKHKPNYSFENLSDNDIPF